MPIFYGLSWLVMFQFLCGAIRTYSKSYHLSFYVSFNSYVVRLELIPVDGMAVLVVRFNSYVVRLERLTFLSLHINQMGFNSYVVRLELHVLQLRV